MAKAYIPRSTRAAAPSRVSSGPGAGPLTDAEAQQALAFIETLRNQGHISAAATPTGPYLHGAGGVFAPFGMSPDIVSAIVQPDDGLRRFLPWRPARTDNPVFGILTQQTASSGSDAAAACDTGKVPGNLALCTQMLPFGEIRMATRAIQINKLGRQINRAEFLDYRLINDPLATVPGTPELGTFDLLNEKKERIREVLFAILRDYGSWDFSGVYAAGPATHQYYGLETQINTGHQDAIITPSVLCPAADSWVDASLSGLSWSANAAQIVRRIHDVVRRQKNLARRAGLDPVQFGLVMQYAQFIEATYYWPCNYYTVGCNGPSGTTINLSGEQLTALRDDMVANGYLLIGGERIPVLTSEYLTEAVIGGGVFASDIYVLPLTSPRFMDTQGWITYYEFLDYNQTLGQAAGLLDQVGGMNDYLVIGGGRYLLYEIAPTGPCQQWGIITEHRIICRAPFLGARFTGIRYTDGVPQRSGIPGDANYYGGGVTTGYPAPAYNTPV